MTTKALSNVKVNNKPNKRPKDRIYRTIAWIQGQSDKMEEIARLEHRTLSSQIVYVLDNWLAVTYKARKEAK